MWLTRSRYSLRFRTCLHLFAPLPQKKKRFVASRLPVHIRLDARLSFRPLTLRLRAEGSRGALSAPLVEIHSEELGCEVSLAQRRSTRSSVPSLRQLWDVDRLQAKASCSLACESLNTKLGVTEPLVEPWRLHAAVQKAAGVRDPSFSVHASELHFNVSKALVKLLESEQLFLTRASDPQRTLSLAASAAARAVHVIPSGDVITRFVPLCATAT